MVEWLRAPWLKAVIDTIESQKLICLFFVSLRKTLYSTFFQEWDDYMTKVIDYDYTKFESNQLRFLTQSAIMIMITQNDHVFFNFQHKNSETD